MPAAPIAVVGRSCVLPGALSPEALWDAVLAGRDLTGHAPEGRWGLPRALALTPDPRHAEDRAWSDVGGYVHGFDAVFDPTGFEGLDPAEVLGLDPLFRWTLHGVRAALREAGFEGPSDRAALILGNLSFPSTAMARYAEHHWLAAQGKGLLGGLAADLVGLARPDARNRFASGLPAHLAAKATGLRGGAFALDAACASSLYAMKLACDRLRDGEADLVVAGAVNRADDLFLHVGFCALSALSKTGRSRPFHRDADGLIPAEGAGFVVLKRLSDALAAGDTVYGVIRGIGLSNDGRAAGFLSPSAAGQVRALRAAYAEAGLSPTEVSLVECHATGTPVGDRAEIDSLSEVFAGASDVPLGSLKSNLGHLITAAGAAGLIKIMGAFAAGMRPPSAHADAPTDALAAPFRLLAKAEPWEGRRVAALSAFGFGGNNAHLVVEAPDARPAHGPAPARPAADLAIVALAARIGATTSTADTARAVISGASLVEGGEARATTVTLPAEGLRFPPNDLQVTLPQQLLALSLAMEATAGLDLPAERTAVLVGMGVDAEIARYGARWRLAGWAPAWGAAVGARPDAAWLATAQDAFAPTLVAAGVVGTMPNIPANRINRQLDLAGPSYTIAGEEASGLRALQVAARALRAGDIDAAVVGATDFSCEPVHRGALAALGIDRIPADAGVVLVVERRADAERLGHPILAVLPGEGHPTARFAPADLAPRLGQAHAASGLVALAAAVWSVRHGRRDGAAWDGPRVAEVVADALGDQRASVIVAGAGATPPLPEHTPTTGRTLSFPAHSAPVVIPALPAGKPVATAAPVASTMPPAPFLPRITEPEPPPVPVPAPARPAASAPLPAATAAASLPLAAPTADPGPLAAFAALQARLGEIHRQHLAQQHALHARFLETRARATAMLLDAARGGVPAPPMPVPVPVPDAALRPAAPPRAPEPAPRPAAPAAPPQAKSPISPAPAPAPTGTGTGGGGKALPGPKYDRRQLEILASGRISDVFGPLFQQQDGYHRQVRMPEPPLLLADRVTGIDAVPGSMKTGTLWTETDVRPDSWYLHDGRMPCGVMIESGQADLLLISWLGADFQNKSERVYRLLGCTLTWHSRDGQPGTVLPVPGETLVYDIHVDGHANQGPIRLFFFHYDCTIGGKSRLTVRGGQAGFFTDAELADSGGVLWDAETGEHDPDAVVAPPPIPATKAAFSRAEVAAFAEGRPWECFGPGWERTKAHVWTPRIPAGDLRFLHEVTAFDAKGGPWKRGYLRAESPVTPEDWFFSGHFKNDPCMPGTMMFEGCIQAMAFYLSALGFTVERDGWSFEPVPEVPYKMVCRGQVTPASKHLLYEVFVESVEDGPTPTLWADLLVTVDGLKAFHARHVGLRLVPDWPLSRPEGRKLLAHGPVPGHVPVHVANARPSAVRHGFAYDFRSLLACAWGRPSEAFGPIYAPFDSPRKVARLPGPPYHFMTRIASIDGDPGKFEQGLTVEVDYDVPADAWYFAENGSAAMPFAVLMEAALQPCGWLASYIGSALTSPTDLLFRNLDGKGTLHRPVRPDDGTLVTKATLKSLSKSAGMILVGFDVACRVGDEVVFAMDTVFGFFPPAAFENQVGVGATPAWTEALNAPSNARIDLSTGALDRTARLARPMLRMIDRITGLWPDGGVHGQGRIRAEKDVDATEWFFKAHFFQDPVQPGSLGVEALCQLLQAWMLERRLDEGLSDPSFEPVMSGEPTVWKYRGQVVPTNRVITTICDVIEQGRDEDGPFVIATGSLWVDGKRIYHLERFGMRIVEGGTDRTPRGGSTTKPREIGILPGAPWMARPGAGAGPVDEVLDPGRDLWLADHCPTWTVPALPMTCMLDRMAAAAGGPPLVLKDVRIHRWLTLPGPVKIRTESEPNGDGTLAVRLLAWREAANPALSRFEPVASGTAVPGPAPLAPASTPDDLAPAPDPYASGALFHGPAFRLLRDLRSGATGATATLEAASPVPYGALNPALLDAATHALPHDDVRRWDPTLPEGHAAYPIRVVEARFAAPAPRAGDVRVDARYLGRAESPTGPRPTFGLRLSAGGTAFADLVLEEVLVPKGPIGTAPAAGRLAFLRDRHPVPGLGLSTRDEHATTLTAAVVRQSDWLPGTVAAAYDARTADLVAEVAVKDHVAALAGAHPSRVIPAPDLLSATTAHHPLTRWPLSLARRGEGVTVRDAGPEQQDLSGVVAWWRDRFGLGHWPVEDLYYGLIERFVRRVTIEDPDGWSRLHGRSVLYLANHQVMCESLLFSVLVSALGGVPTVTLAKVEHKTSWLGRLIDHAFGWPGAVDPGVITFFDREDKSSLPRIIGELAAEMTGPGKSVMVHVEGTRSLTCRTPVLKMSGAFVDMALATKSPIVPVRLVGGLPAEPLAERVEFPVGHGRQDYVLGKALMPEDLARMPLKERKEAVIAAINGTGPSAAIEEPLPGDPDLEAAAAAHAARTGCASAHATLLEVLRGRVGLHPALEPVVAGVLDYPDTAEGRWLATLARRLHGPDAPIAR